MIPYIYILIPQISVCKFIFLSVCMSVCLSHISQTFHTIAFALGRYVARVPIMCTVLCEVVSMRASYTFYWVSGRGYVNVYRPPFAICSVHIGRQVAHLGPWRTIEANLSVFVCADGLALVHTLPPITPSTGTCTSWYEFTRAEIRDMLCELCVE